MTDKRHLHVGQIRAVLEQVIRNLSIDGHMTLASELSDVLATVAPDCPGCKAFHESYPTIRHFHHPSCPDRDKCAMCGTQMEASQDEEERYFRMYYGCQVGAICGECYEGNPVKNGDAP